MRKRKYNTASGGVLHIVGQAVIKILVLSMAVVIAVLLVGVAISSIFRNSDYFRTREVVTNVGSGVNLSYLKDENIFALDLSRESGYILEQNPSYRSVRLVRIPPDRLFVYFVKRRPVALVKLFRTFSLDQDGVLFETPQEWLGVDMPVITGLETKIFGPKSGKKYNIRELGFALNIIKAFKFNRVLRFYNIKRIDVANISNASAFITLASDMRIPELIEIKMWEDGIKGRMNILAMLLLPPKDNSSPGIKYIDLRFNDPLIKLKDK